MSIDIIVLILTGIWLSELDFSNLSTLQILGLALAIVMIVLMVIKFFKKGE
ncbi:hypothetical protein [Clostridium sp.]|uniref:hypothetical protein n=1 Tax=Clostridium sp. TaxID=1506 RepID=UPI00285289F9|nr:hypothetical protein [Clostridium sp.]